MNKNRKDETIPSVYGALLLAMVEGFEFFVYGPLFLALLEGLGFLLFGWLPAPYGGFGAMIVALIVMAVISAFGLVWALALLWDQRKSGAYRLAWILIGAIIHAGVSLSVFSMFSA